MITSVETEAVNREMVSGLHQPRAYPHAVSSVRMLETNMSWLFFAGPRVYKIKKPVDLGFADLTDPDFRHWLCEEEVRLNRRLAPDVYRGVVPIVHDSDGWHVDGEGQPVAWAVEMVRLPATRMLDRRLDEGTLDNELLENLARMLADFHARAATGPGVNEHGEPSAVCDLVVENLAALRAFSPSSPSEAPGGLRPLSRLLLDHVETRLRHELREHHHLFVRRVQARCIREGHGDLHAGNICILDEGPLAYDALEFSVALRCTDVAADLAFLTMDMDLRGERGFARYLVRRYAQLAGDPDVVRLMDFYKTHRALVRSKVACLRAADLTGDAREDELSRARRYAHLAASYQLPPAMIVMCGAPGSGKSWLAKRLARPFEARVLRSDVLRKRLAGLSPCTYLEAEFGQGLYDEASVNRTYHVLLDDAISELERGRSVVVDASFSQAAHRSRFLDASLRLHHPTVLVHVDTPEDVAEKRQRRRQEEGTDPSDAHAEIMHDLRDHFAEPTEVHSSLRIDVYPDHDPDIVVGRVVDRFIQQVSRKPPV